MAKLPSDVTHRWVPERNVQYSQIASTTPRVSRIPRTRYRLVQPLIRLGPCHALSFLGRGPYGPLNAFARKQPDIRAVSQVSALALVHLCYPSIGIRSSIKHNARRYCGIRAQE